jgi:hypothetical protein
MAAATTSKSKTRPVAAAKARPVQTDRPVRQATRRDNRETIDRGVEATDQVLDQVETGGRNAIGAVRRFVDSVDSSLAGEDEGPTRAHDVVDAALVMSDRMVELGGDAIRSIVRSVGSNVGTPAK